MLSYVGLLSKVVFSEAVTSLVAANSIGIGWRTGNGEWVARKEGATAPSKAFILGRLLYYAVAVVGLCLRLETELFRKHALSRLAGLRGQIVSCNCGHYLRP